MRLWLVREVPVAWHSKKSPGSLTNKQTKNPLSFLPKQDCYLNRVNSLSHFLTSTEEGNPWWYEGSSCLQMVCRHLDLQVFPSLQVFPLIFASLSLRHSTGLAQNVPGTTVFLMLHDLCFGDFRQQANFRTENDPASSKDPITVGRVAFLTGALSTLTPWA